MLTYEQKRQLITTDVANIPVLRQCELLGISLSTYYYKNAQPNADMERLMNLLDQHFTEHPHEGKIKRARWLSSKVGYVVGRKLVATLMKKMGLETVYPKPNTSGANKKHAIYPYLLGDKVITAPNQVWSADITYIPLLGSHVYLVAIVDWYSRYVIEWSLSNTLEASFCVAALQDALSKGKCDIFNTDQGSQFTSEEWIQTLVSAGINISMDGKGRYLDNIFVERLWRSVKQECVYLNDFTSIAEVQAALKKYFKYYNIIRLHQALDYRTPAMVHYEN